MTTEAVTRYYAPQVRVIDAASGELVGATPVPGTSDGEPLVHFDVVSVRVTLVHTDVSQVQIVLNNKSFDGDGLPRVPPWKYNALDRITFGQRLRIEMTYGHQPWTKMILAQVNELQFGFGASGDQLTVIGEDLLSVLKRKPDRDKRYGRLPSEAQIVSDVVERSGGPRFTGVAVSDPRPDPEGWVTNRGPLLAWPSFSEQTPTITHQKAQTYLQFLQSIASRMDFEIFVDFARNYLPPDATGQPAAGSSSASGHDPDPNEVLLHFEPARSLLDGGQPPLWVDLTYGVNLIQFSPTFKLWDLPTSFTQTGRTPARVERVLNQVDQDAEIDALVAEDLGRLSDEDPRLAPLPATRLRRDFMAAGGVPPDSPLEVTFTNLDQERAVLKAKAEFRARVRSAMTAEAQTIGFPSLRAGMHVNLGGVHPPFDGLYYVTKAIHTFDAGGYKTQLSLRRPGMQPPGQFPRMEASS